MERRLMDKDAHDFNAILTDEMIEQANAITNDKVHGCEVRERYCKVWSDMFAISCETRLAYEDVLFKVVDGKIEFYHMDGCFKD